MQLTCDSSSSSRVAEYWGREGAPSAAESLESQRQCRSALWPGLASPEVTWFSLPLLAFADVSGKLRIWDTTQKDHLLKYEYQPFAGKIKDVAWTEDSKRIAVVGEGREK